MPGMRNSADKIAPGVDVRGTGGYVIRWDVCGFGVLDETEPAEWPTWLIEQTRIKVSTGKVQRPAEDIAPPSAQAVVELLNRTPNPLEAGRDVYNDIALATAGCMHALIALDRCTPVFIYASLS